MNSKITNNYLHDIAAGRVDKRKVFHKFGRSATSASPTTVWTGNSIYTYPGETAIKLYLSSSEAADTAQKIKIYGLDGNKKLQSEVVVSDGTTAVATAYDYTRVFRANIVDGPINVGTISLKNLAADTTYLEIDFDADGDGQGQTEMCIYTVPAGHKLLIDNVQASSYTGDETNIILSARDWKAAEAVGGTNPPFVTKFNTQIYRNVANLPQTPSREFGQLIDLEARSYNDGGTGFASVMLDGVLEQINSVPVDITSFSATAGDGEVTLSWDEMTPAETSDMKGFEISMSPMTSYPDGVKTILITDKDASGLVVDGLDNGTEYTFTITWVGYDNLTSSTETDTATPEPYIPPSTGSVAIFAKSSIGSDVLTGDYFVSTDEGVNWSSDTIGAATDGMGHPQTDGTNFYSNYNTLTNISTDGDTWTNDGEATSALFATSGLVLRAVTGGIEYIIDGGDNWSSCSGITSISIGVVLLGSTYYVVGDSDDIYSSSDGETWTVMTNQPTIGIDFFNSNGTVLLVTDIGASDEMSYQYAAGDVAWATGTSTASPTAMALTEQCVHDGYFYTIAVEGDFSADYFEKSSDGDTWTSVTAPVVSNGLGISVGSDGDNLYVAQADVTGIDCYITVDDGAGGWETPIKVTTASTLIVAGFAGTV